MFQTVGSFLQSVNEKGSELEQALIRVVLTLAISAYMSFSFFTDTSSPVPKLILIYSFGFLFLSVLIAVDIFRSQQSSKNRQILAMVADMSAVTFVMSVTREASTLFFGIYLWVIVGNGLRYGSKSLITAQIIGIIGFAGVVMLNDFWSKHLFLAVGSLLILLLIPLYIFKLLQRLNQAVMHAEEASKAKSYFLANMSHEMRTPLNGVIGASDLILETPLNAEQKDLVQTLRNSGQILLKLIENVLDLSKIESGKLVAETVDFDLHRLINNIMDMFLPQAEKKGLRLQVRFSPETCFLLRGDPQHLRQIVINLVANAIKFTSKGSVELRISTLSQDEAGTHLKFEVIDTGIGIAQESQQAIFESFTQADASITRQYGGTGLGTTIAKQLVQFMGGQIGLHSEVNVGSVFWFELPFTKQTENKLQEVMPTLEQIRVIELGISDNECSALENHLSGWGVRFDHAESFANLYLRLAKIYSSQPQNIVILCTPQHLGMDAKEFASQVLTGFTSNTVSLILVDPDLQDNTEDELLETGYSCLLKTPINKTLLFNALHGVMVPQPESSALSFGEHYERNSLAKLGLNILVADDNGTNRKIISKILERAGHQVDMAENGEEALDKLESKQYDLAILDMYMPDIGGLEAVKIYRVTNNHQSTMPIAILTANVTLEARRECQEAGVNAFLTKPIDAHTLLDTVAQLTANRTKSERSQLLNINPVPIIPGGVVLLNENTLRSLELLGGRGFVDTLIQGFIAEGEQILEDMKSALLKHEYTTFKKHAHTLKGSSGNVGAEILLQICQEISQLNHSDWQAPASDLLGKAVASLKSTQLAIVQYADSPQRALLVTK